MDPVTVVLNVLSCCCCTYPSKYRVFHMLLTCRWCKSLEGSWGESHATGYPDSDLLLSYSIYIAGPVKCLSLMTPRCWWLETLVAVLNITVILSLIGDGNFYWCDYYLVLFNPWMDVVWVLQAWGALLIENLQMEINIMQSSANLFFFWPCEGRKQWIMQLMTLWTRRNSCRSTTFWQPGAEVDVLLTSTTIFLWVFSLYYPLN